MAEEAAIWKPEGELPFKTAREIEQETPTEVPWRAKPLLSDGAITEVDGKVKASGKTTFVLHVCSAIVRGRPFMGERTQKSGVVFLTEQSGPSFGEALEDADLLDREDFVILQYSDVVGKDWSMVANAAADEAIRRGYKVLVVDTIGQFTGLRGDAENNAGAALEAMGPLQEAAARGLVVIFTRHERKSGGEVGDSGRGSSAYSGAVDRILSLSRPEGKTRNTVRKIETLGRFTETPAVLMVEKTEKSYRSLGTEEAVEKNEARTRLLEAAPTSEAEAKPKKDLLDEAKVKYATGHYVLGELVNAGGLRRVGEGKKGDPHKFWRPDPPGGPESEGDKLCVAPKVEVGTERRAELEASSATTTETMVEKHLSPDEIRSVRTTTLGATQRNPTEGGDYDPIPEEGQESMEAALADDWRDHPLACECEDCLYGHL